eukprot:TRINITY_DN240_c0_g1_i4.p1 TRINITY_DN240_c0_g1~~TRINITY_DN240_c0_g1_i4.p1  ORF type:complete len:224 (+),score=29.55 TRINITY_DN240_c0_g1_i4:137-808(+)
MSELEFYSSLEQVSEQYFTLSQKIGPPSKKTLSMNSLIEQKIETFISNLSINFEHLPVSKTDMIDVKRAIEECPEDVKGIYLDLLVHFSKKKSQDPITTLSRCVNFCEIDIIDIVDMNHEDAQILRNPTIKQYLTKVTGVVNVDRALDKCEVIFINGPEGVYGFCGSSYLCVNQGFIESKIEYALRNHDNETKTLVKRLTQSLTILHEFSHFLFRYFNNYYYS